MAALSPTAVPDSAAIRAFMQASARGTFSDENCIVAVRAYSRTRNGKQESVSAYTRSNPDCGAGEEGSWVRVNERGSVPPGFGQRLPGPQDPVGRLRGPTEIEPGTNPPGSIRGRPYSGHALDRM
jgi:hypothetical protein